MYKSHFTQFIEKWLNEYDLYALDDLTQICLFIHPEARNLIGCESASKQ